VEVGHVKAAMTFILDGPVKSRNPTFSVIPVKTGIQEYQTVLDSSLRGSDPFEAFIRDLKIE
jgi:hypothetical protein